MTPTRLVRGAGASLHFKDEILDELAGAFNVAQFASFGPDLSLRFLRIRGYSPNEHVGSLRAVIEALLRQSVDQSVNVRSYAPDAAKSREFTYGLRSVDQALDVVSRLGDQALYTIVNETLDIHDGGVSGVILGELAEFAPDSTPRCVEEPGIAALPLPMARGLLKTVYGIDLPTSQPTDRLEFSIHPRRCGWKDEHAVVWEREQVMAHETRIRPLWPNRFSRFVGDKAFGLLLAHLAGLCVPRTMVLARRVSPFSFGASTETGEYWVRTCPSEPHPGLFTSRLGWLDPFKLVSSEDSEHNVLSSLLSQENVDARFSGALISDKAGRLTIEGVPGRGDRFMIGQASPSPLPKEVVSKVEEEYRKAEDCFGPVRVEWAFDGRAVWILQLHAGATESSGHTIVPGRPAHFFHFDAARGIEEFRTTVEAAAKQGHGIVLHGNVGISSHLGDILRRRSVPSRLEP